MSKIPIRGSIPPCRITPVAISFDGIGPSPPLRRAAPA